MGNLGLPSLWPWLLAGFLAVTAGSYIKGRFDGSAACAASEKAAHAVSVVRQAKAMPKEEAAVRSREAVSEVHYKTLTKQVIKYVKDDRSCDLGPDASRLLNGIR